MSTRPDLTENLWVTEILSGTSTVDFPSTATTHQLLDLVDQQGVAPLLYHQLLQSNQLQSLSDELQIGLSTLNRKHLAADLASRAEFCRLMELFQNHQLPFILMKGEALSHSVYAEPHLRAQCDVDLLFADKASTEHAWHLLKQEGFSRSTPMQGEFVGFQFTCHKAFSNGVNSVLDIHHQITNYNWFNSRLPFSLLFENSQSITIDSLKVKILNPVFALIHACVHRITNQPHDTQNRLIWLYDIHLLSQRMTAEEWGSLLRWCKQLELSNIILQGLRAGQAYFKTPIDESHLDELKRQANINSDPFTGSRRRLQMQLADLMHNKGLLNKMRHIRERLFPPADYIMQIFNRPNRRWLWFFYLKRLARVMLRR